MKQLTFPLKLGLAMLCAGVVMSLTGGTAHAATNQAPDPTYFSPYNNEEWMLTSHAYDPDLNFIDAPVSQVKIYSTTKNFRVTIHNPNVCRNGQSLDVPFKTTGSPVGAFTSFRVYPLAADEATPTRTTLLAAYTGQSMNQDDSQACGADAVLNFTINTPSTIPGHAGMYVAYFEAVFGGTTRGYNNRFKLSMSDPNGIIAYSDGTSVSQAYKFAIIADRRPVEFGGRATYWSTEILPFAPSCSVKTAQNVQLRWFDDDYGQFNQTRTASMELQKFNASTRAFVSSQNLGTPNAGPNTAGSRTVLIEPGFIYQWVWHNVQYNNGLQFQMPFDSIYFYKPCLDFNLDPDIGTVIDGGAVIGDTAEPGQTVQFFYRINNTGTTDSTTATCTIYGNVLTGYVPTPPTPRSSSTAGYVPPPTSCPRTFPAKVNTQVATETIIMPANRTVCRSLFVDPARQSPPGGSKGKEVCIKAGSKPYLRVYGGDVSAGNGFATTSPTTCATNTQAAIVSWNKEGPTYSGAGVQFAALATKQIYDFATALGNTGGAPAGSGLAFANKTPSGGNFGGSFGALPCATNFYATKGTTSTITSPASVGGLATSSYAATVPVGQALQISGNLNAAQKTVVYVDGNVLITGDIKFPASWTMANRPYFQLIVRGNIYVSQNVRQLDGIYSAQRNGSSGGIIYTCANPGLPAAAVSINALAGSCANTLTINGSFVAYQVQFLRAHGSLSQSTAGETSAASNAAEVFNYSPALWMTMPPGNAVTSDYDSITSLPPVL